MTGSSEVQRITGMRIDARLDRRSPDEPFFPAHACPEQQGIPPGSSSRMLQYFVSSVLATSATASSISLSMFNSPRAVCPSRATAVRWFFSWASFTSNARCLREKIITIVTISNADPVVNNVHIVLGD